ncbi:MAG: protein kinase, partial [Cyanobacteria bacterium J06648_11]
DENILVSDVALAHILDPNALNQELMGAGSYVAPEVRRGQVGRKSDVFSLGVIVAELVTSEAPSASLAENVERVRVRKENCRSFCFRTLLILVESMLLEEPDDRPSSRHVTRVITEVREQSHVEAQELLEARNDELRRENGQLRRELDKLREEVRETRHGNFERNSA